MNATAPHASAAHQGQINPSIREICASLDAAPAAKRPQRARKSARPPVGSFPVRYLAQKELYRAIVSLPAALCPRDEPLHERIVFFDGPRENPGEYLETLLAHAWHVDTIGWWTDGVIYNLASAAELTLENVSTDMDARLFELSWGGPERIGYADPARVDLFVAPRLKARLQTALDRLPKIGGAA